MKYLLNVVFYIIDLQTPLPTDKEEERAASEDDDAGGGRRSTDSLTG